MTGIDKTARLLYSVTLGLLLAGCAVSLQMASHQPAHPIHENVNLSARATGQVSKIELWLTEYNIKTDGSLDPVGPESMVKSCNPMFWKSTLECSLTMLLNSDHSLMEYEARAYSFLGGQKSEAYRFASGQYHHDGAGEVPTAKEPIPIRVNSFDVQGYLDVAMIPDPDLLNLAAPDPVAGFRSQLHEVIAMYFQYEAIRKARGLFNFYYSPHTGHYEVKNGDCTWDGPENLADLETTADVILYLHQTDLLDCKQGAKISSEIHYDKTLVHESGHGLFGLRDEYRICDGSYYPDQANQVCKRNIWRKKDHPLSTAHLACQNDVPPGLQPGDCTYIIPPGKVYKVDPADVGGLQWSNDQCQYIFAPGDENRSGCIMGDLQHNDPSDFGPACLQRIDFRYAWCLSGDCMPTSECL
jgi:hypothetical protein